MFSIVVKGFLGIWSEAACLLKNSDRSCLRRPVHPHKVIIEIFQNMT
jgi:hypothetical protein